MSTSAKDPLGRWLAAGAVVLAIVAIVGAVRVMGTPGEQRAQRLDDRRVLDMRRLVRTIRAAYVTQDRLPRDLAALGRPIGEGVAYVDPETRKPYEYRVLDAGKFEVCAHFVTATVDPDADYPHRAGRQCFTRKAKARD